MNGCQFAFRSRGAETGIGNGIHSIMHPPLQSGNGPSPHRQLRRWFSGSPGAQVLHDGAQRLRQILPNLFGYHIVQIGCYGESDLLSASRIAHRVAMQTETDAAAGDVSMVKCSAAALAVASDSVDVVVLPHVLEFEGDPHQVLREVERVLIGEGHAVIVGFNPWSLWGLCRMFLAWSDRAPWCGRFLSLPRLKDWLRLLGFEVVSRQYFFYRPPVSSAGLLNRLAFLERLGRHLCPALGAAYVVVARKRLEQLIPIKAQWRLRRSLIAAGVAEPSTRGTLVHE